ncbi:hypothetical protein Bca52824_009796 [Brassica carinata]|uniref:Uncharacterized protein n=1 Tax=Brassica carinata TaxID=52824 RepID=A0A8X8BA84_BRACI|nr:hypothetical protein Bca52824_009796 [Brassica carinata]
MFWSRDAVTCRGYGRRSRLFRLRERDRVSPLDSLSRPLSSWWCVGSLRLDSGSIAALVRGESRLGAVLIVPDLYSRLWLPMARAGVSSRVPHSRLWLFQALFGASLSFRLHHLVISLRPSLVLRPLLYWSRALVLSLSGLLLTRVDCLQGTFSVSSVLEDGKRRHEFVIKWRCLSWVQLPSQCR